MPVIDASVVVDSLVVVGPAGEAARAELRGLSELQVPSIFAAEVTSALRRLVNAELLSPVRAATALSAVLSMRTIQYPFEPFALRAWQLRENLTMYDAWYVALAEQLGTELVTADKRLAAARGPRCRIRLVGTANRG
jgi:predicted nucleic acid-binding protein